MTARAWMPVWWTPMWMLAGGCVHTPPHDPVGGAWKKDFVRREEMREDGTFCSWEAESLVYEGAPVWSAEPPTGQNWCGTADEVSRYFDVLGQDGPFLSVHTVETGCCPERSSAECVTWNLSTGQPATLTEYDEKHAAKRWLAAQVALAGSPWEGYLLIPDAFLVVDGGHVAVCAYPPSGAKTPADIRTVVVK